MNARNLRLMRLLVMVVVCALIAQPLAPGLAASAQAMSASAENDVVWASILMDGKTYEIHAILNLPDASLSTRAFNQADLTNLRHIYIEREDEFYSGEDARKAFLLVQNARDVYRELNEAGVSQNTYIDGDYADFMTRIPAWINLCAFDPPYDIWVPSTVSSGFKDMFIFSDLWYSLTTFSWITGPNALDCQDYRSEMYVDLLLDAALQSDFYGDLNDDQELETRLNSALKTIQPGMTGIEAASAILGEANYYVLSRASLDDLINSRVLDGLFNASEFFEILNVAANIARIENTAYSIRTDAAEYLLKVSMANQRGEERMLALKAYIEQNASHLDPALVDAMDPALAAFYDIKSNAKMTLEQAIGQSVLDNGVDVAVSLISILDLTKNIITQALGFGPAFVKIFRVLGPYLLAYELFQATRGQQANAQRSALALTLQRDLWDDVSGTSLKEMAASMSTATTIDSDDAIEVIQLYQVNTYLSWAYYHYLMEITGNWASDIWGSLTDILNLSPDNPYEDYIVSLNSDLEDAWDLHMENSSYYLATSTSSLNDRLVSKILDEPLPPLPEQLPEISFLNPGFSGATVSGSMMLEVVTNADIEPDYVEFQITLPSDFDIDYCIDDSAPFQCDWNTLAVLYDGARYDIQAVAHAGEMQYSAATWVMVDNSNYNYPPEFELTTPDGESAYQRFIIRWTDYDPDSSARIDLYYDTNNSGCNGTPIVRWLNEDWTDNRYIWSIDEDIPSDDYWVYAVVNDNANPPICVYSPGSLEITYPAQQESFSVERLETLETGGDGDGVLDIGETFELEVFIHNTASVDRANVRGRLTTSELGVKILDDYVRYLTVPAQTTPSHVGDFNFETKLNAEENLSFTLEVFYTDLAGNEYVDVNTLNVTLQQNDITPPTISWGPTVTDIQPDAATISWGTDEPANSVVDYGETVTFDRQAVDSVYTTDHQVTLRGLKPSTQHFFQISSSDPSQNGPVQAQGSFTTTNLGAGLHVLDTYYDEFQYIFGMAWDSVHNSLWLLDRDSSSNYRIVQYDPVTRNELSAFPVNFMPEYNNHARGLAFDGTYLWMADSSDELIYKLSTSGGLVAQYPYGREPSGLAWDGSSLWVSDQETNQICQLNAAIQPVYCFTNPGTVPVDFDFDGANFWLLDSGTNLLYHVTPTGTRLDTYPLYGLLGRSVVYQSNGLWISINSTTGFDWLARTSLLEDTASPGFTSGPSANSEIGTAAQISWTTDEPANSMVMYGLSGCTTTYIPEERYTMEHAVVLTGLLPNTTYHYCAGSQDLPDNLPTWSAESTFTTAGQTGLNVTRSIYAFDDSQRGMTFDSTYMWAIENADQGSKLMKIDPASGRNLGLVWIPTADDPQGLAWDGSAFWYYEYSTDPERLYRISTSGSVLRYISAPDNSINDLEYANGALWAVDLGDLVYQINPSTGSVISSFSTAWGDVRYLAHDGTYLWLYNIANNNIYKATTSGTLIAAYPSPTTNAVQALAWWNGGLWVMSGTWRYRLVDTPSYAPVVAKVTASGLRGGIFRSGSLVQIEVIEQFGRAGYSGTVTISSATDDPGIVNAPLMDAGSGVYIYTWNTAGQMAATDYQVEVRLTDGIYSDSDGLDLSPDLSLVLAPTLSNLQTYNLALAGNIGSHATVGTDFWITEGGIYPQSIRRVDAATGVVVASCPAAKNVNGSTGAKGITWDGSQLWVANSYYNPELTRHATNCTISSRIAYPGDYPYAIAWDGSSLWVSDPDENRIYHLNTSGSILGTLLVPTFSPLGLTWDGSNLWAVDPYTQGMTRVNRTTGAVEQYYALSTPITSLSWYNGSFYGESGDLQIIRLGVKPDLALAPLTAITQSVPEGGVVNLTATAFAHDLASTNVELNYYLGHPDAGGELIPPTRNLGTVTPGTPALALLEWSTLTPGEYNLCARIDPLDVVDESDELNNTHCLEIDVFDTDIEPPDLENLLIQPNMGDGDTYLEDNEQVSFTWNASDSSGILTAMMEVDGITYPATLVGPGAYQVITPPLPAGELPFTITLTDGDNTPETLVYSGILTVFEAAPSVTAVYPLPDSTNVEVLPEIQTLFDMEMFIVQGAPISGAILVTDSDGNTVLGEVLYDTQTWEMDLALFASLDYGTAYTITLPQSTSVTDELGNTLEADLTWHFTTQADTQAPTLELQHPKPNEVLSGMVDVLGILIDPTLEEYWVEYGIGSAPVAWTEIQRSGAIEVLGGRLAVWDTTELPAGIYTLRAGGVDRFGNQAQVSVIVEVHNPDLALLINSVNPAEILVGSETTVHIFGAHFAEGAVVRFDEFPAALVTWVDSTHLEAVTPTSLPIGEYDVTVDNGGGITATLPGALDVIDILRRIFLPLITR